MKRSSRPTSWARSSASKSSKRVVEDRRPIRRDEPYQPAALGRHLGLDDAAVAGVRDALGQTRPLPSAAACASLVEGSTPSSPARSVIRRSPREPSRSRTSRWPGSTASCPPGEAEHLVDDDHRGRPVAQGSPRSAHACLDIGSAGFRREWHGPRLRHSLRGSSFGARFCGKLTAMTWAIVGYHRQKLPFF